MDKKAVAELLGVTTRSVEKYAKSGKLSVKYIPIKNGRQAEYNESEVLALKEELAMVVHRSVVDPNTSEGAISEVFGSIEMLLALIEKIMLYQLPKYSPLAQFEELEKAAANGWVLSTSMVREIAKVTPKGTNFPYGSFVFVRTGKVGREAGWVVQNTGYTVGHTGTFALDASNALGDETTTHAGVILDEQVMSLIKESPRL